MSRRLLLLAAVLLLAGCAGQAPSPAPSAPPESVADPLRCAARAECTTKVARSLMFVFDSAELGAPLLRREGRRLFTPPEVPPDHWPLVEIVLPEAEHSRFAFSSRCLQAPCRWSEAELQAIFRRYLEGDTCLAQPAGCH